LDKLLGRRIDFHGTMKAGIVEKVEVGRVGFGRAEAFRVFDRMSSDRQRFLVHDVVDGDRKAVFPRLQHAADLGFERREASDMFGDRRSVHVHVGGMRGRTETQHDPFFGQGRRNHEVAFVPDPADMLANFLHHADIVIRRRNRHAGLALQRGRFPMLIESGSVIELERPDSVEVEHGAGIGKNRVQHINTSLSVKLGFGTVGNRDLVFVGERLFDFGNLALDLFHFPMIQLVKFHGDDRSDPAEDRNAEHEEQSDGVQACRQRRIDLGEGVFKADRGQEDADDRNAERRDDFVDERKEGPDHARRVAPGQMKLVVGSVGDHRNDHIAGHAHESVTQSIQNEKSERHEAQIRQRDVLRRSEYNNGHQQRIGGERSPGRGHERQFESAFSRQPDSEEGEQQRRQHDNEGDRSAQRVVPDDQAEEDDRHDRLADDRCGQFIRGSCHDQHLQRTVAANDGPVVLDRHFGVLFRESVIFQTVFVPDADNGQNRKDRGSYDHDRIEFREEAQIESAVFRYENRGDKILPAHEQQRIVRSVESDENRPLLRIVRQHRLRGFRAGRLERIADDIDGVDGDKERQSPFRRQYMRNIEHEQNRNRQDQVAQQHERPELSDPGLRFVDDVADNRVGESVENARSRSQRADDHHQQPGDSGRVVRGKAHGERIQIRCRIVQSEKTNLP